MLLLYMQFVSGCEKEPHLVSARMKAKDCTCECTTEIQDEDNKHFFIPTNLNK